MRALRYVLLASLVLGCTADRASPAIATASPVETGVNPVSAQDNACARKTVDRLIAAMNRADEPELGDLLRSSAFNWAASGRTTTTPGDAVTLLMTRSRQGERWVLRSLDVNGRGWHGGIDFGLQLRRSAPDLAAPYVESAGKGVLDCPEQRFRILGLGG